MIKACEDGQRSSWLSILTCLKFCICKMQNIYKRNYYMYYDRNFLQNAQTKTRCMCSHALLFTSVWGGMSVRHRGRDHCDGGKPLDWTLKYFLSDSPSSEMDLMDCLHLFGFCHILDIIRSSFANCFKNRVEIFLVMKPLEQSNLS